ncbi:MAG: hypothetical protein IPM47_00250 [Sphingobacteriales bacterium]|nr:MAG: hypothetical protein IPM47_00250 [Sphingobacteriales bacterium]
MNNQIEDVLGNNWSKLMQKCETTLEEHRPIFNDILKRYAQKGRFYHTAKHLCQLFLLLEKVAEKLTAPEAVYWAVFYHDIVYNPLRKDNEHRSAKYARKMMQQLKIQEDLILLTEQLIVATQTHIAPAGSLPDFLYFLDADLAILGAKPEKYDQYSNAIRKEYRFIPDFMYRPGRKKVLEQLLSKPALYYTPPFLNRFEAQARENMLREIQSLS